MKIAALIVAAGRGSRAGGEVPKQYAWVGGHTVLTRTVSAFLSHPNISVVQVVIHKDDISSYQAALVPLIAPGLSSNPGAPLLGPHYGKLCSPVSGGETRQQSVLHGLKALKHADPSGVLIHDAARPFVSEQTISRVIDAMHTTHGAIAAVPLSDTLKRDNGSGRVAETIERAGLWRAQTPQGFDYTLIADAHKRALSAGLEDFTDDAAIAEWAGLDVALVEDSAANIKLTTAEDIAAADRRLRNSMDYETRTGTGFDVHKFCDGDHVWLGGAKIAHTHGLEGHSDADVVLHALTDAILGAIGDGDIGQHFPPSDPKWKGAPSKIFLEDAARRVRERGGKIVNVDVTVLAEAPKIGPHRPAMQVAIAATLGVTPDRVGIKATTTEGLGFTGRREGIAAQAVATVYLAVKGQRD